MFERYTEKARRVIFFARYEAAQFGSPYIEPEHLLLGILREDKVITNRFLRNRASVESIRKQIEGHTIVREKASTSVDLPLANDAKRVLAYAVEEAERLAHKHIGTEHLLLGILRESESFAAQLLTERGVEIAQVRADAAAGEGEARQRHWPTSPPPVPKPPPDPPIPIRFVDARSGEALCEYDCESPSWRFPAIGETVDFRDPANPNSPGRAFRVENVTTVYVLQKTQPEDVIELQKRIEFIVERSENAVANHEFEKARFYSDEERKVRDNLRALEEKYQAAGVPPAPEPKTPQLQEIVIALAPKY